MRTVAPVKTGGKLYPGIHLGETVVSDMIRIACVACRAKIGVNPSQIGGKIRCPKCMEEFVAEEPKVAKPAVAKAIVVEPADEELEEEFREEKAELKKKKRRKEKEAAERLVTTIMAGGGVLLVLIAAGLFYLFSPASRPVTPSKPDFTLDADDLYGHYRQNVADADRIYTGKWVKVKGTIKGVKRTDSGQYYLYMFAGWDDRGILVFCDQSEASKTEFGDQIYATGYVSQYVAGQVHLLYSKVDVNIKVNKNPPNPNAR